MQLPEQLRDRLERDLEMQSVVNNISADFEEWFRHSQTVFSPYFTDHTIKHVEEVIETATALMTPASLAILTPKDAGMLIIAVLLHDAAMHLTKEGFVELIKPTREVLVRELDTVPWSQLWESFLFSARHFDDETIQAIFGEHVAIRRPSSNHEEWTGTDLKLVGEFLRRHHGRLAHEIALNGVPGPGPDHIRISERLNPHLVDLAGLIARSHTMPLRSSLDYLERHFDLRDFQQVHAVYLMVLLRVADYLQIQASRAPYQVMQVKAIKSSISNREWQVHRSIVDISTQQADPESILIRAKPQDISTFLRLKEWLGGIQEELDTSWAVLGEIYARFGLEGLGITFRRVRSNLDDTDRFSQVSSFVPERIEFDIARADTLKLLVRPLYGNKPEIGIRELMQNGVDAVRELWDLQEKDPGLRHVELIEQEGDVEIWVDEPDETGYGWVTVSDRGTGMTVETIRDYFLKVGASYRKSEAWSHDHERAEVEVVEGKRLRSRVLRSGRFGIGVLAAFLLGDYIEVSTRHVMSSSGIRFSTKLDPQPIELRHDPSLKFGTTIRVRINAATTAHLIATARGTSEREVQTALARWDWFCFARPKVLRFVGRNRNEVQQRYFISSEAKSLPAHWHQLAAEGYEAIYWSFEGHNKLWCNGIFVPDNNIQLTHNPFNQGGGVIDAGTPLISVLDPDAKLPLNLQRSRLESQDLDFQGNLANQVFQYILAYLLHRTPEAQWLGLLPLPKFLRDGGGYSGAIVWLPWSSTKFGLTLLSHLSAANVKKALICIKSDDPSEGGMFASPKGEMLLQIVCESPAAETYDAILYGELRPRDYVRSPEIFLAQVLPAKIPKLHVDLNGSLGQFLHYLVGSRFVTSKKYVDDLMDILSVQSIPYKLEEINNDLIVISQGICPNTRDNLLQLMQETRSTNGKTNFLAVAEWFFSAQKVKGKTLYSSSPIAKHWDQIFGQAVIPYDPAERRRVLAHAYEQLAEYISDFESDDPRLRWLYE
jgi:molecular chaperone HtpG